MQDVALVGLVHLFHEDEGENSVRPESKVVWRKSFPQTKETFFSGSLANAILRKVHTVWYRYARTALTIVYFLD